MDWKRKLTSRKFWMAIAGFVVGMLALLGIDGNTTQQVAGVVMSLGSVVAYIVGEGLVDASHTEKSIETNIAPNPPTK